MADFSCYVTIYNNTPYTMTLTGSGDSWGKWTIEPPKTIAPFSVTSKFQLEDKAGASGSEGYVIYKASSPDADSFRVDFCDPYSGSNTCSISNPNMEQFGVCFTADSGDGAKNNMCPPSGHPLTMNFYITSFV